jgi:hypothetical protein
VGEVGVELAIWKVPGLEVHFGKPVVARVKKCRLVVVPRKKNGEDGCDCAERRE